MGGLKIQVNTIHKYGAVVLGRCKHAVGPGVNWLSRTLYNAAMFDYL
jgi:hypothetical protein